MGLNGPSVGADGKSSEEGGSGAPKPGRRGAEPMSPAPRRRRCGAMQVHERLLETYPSFRQNEARIDQFTERSIAPALAQRVTRRVITIPVVVHVVYKRAGENISKAQIRSQISRPEQRLPRHQPRQEQGAGRLAGAGRATPRSSSPWRPQDPDGQADRRHHADEDHARLVRYRRRPVKSTASRGRRPPGRASATSTSGCATWAAACSATRSSRAARRAPTAW